MKTRAPLALLVASLSLLALPTGQANGSKGAASLDNGRPSTSLARGNANRVANFNRRSGRLTVYVSKRRKVVGKVDGETHIYCGDSRYFLDDELEDESFETASFGDEDELDEDEDEETTPEDEVEDEFDDIDEELAECDRRVIRKGTKLSDLEFSTHRGRVYFDELEVR